MTAGLCSDQSMCPLLPPRSASRRRPRHHAVLHDTAEEEMLDPEEPVEDGRPSSAHLLRLRRRAFMKKLLTVDSSRPSCCEMVTCSSLDGRWFSLKMAWSVRRCRSVNTSLVRLGPWLRSSLLCSCSLRLHAAGQHRGGGNELANSGRLTRTNGLSGGKVDLLRENTLAKQL